MPVYQGKDRPAEYVGCVVNETERNGYNDSDFYCTVWDQDRQTFRSFEWGTTRFACLGNGYGCQVDATDEVKAAYEFYEATRAEWHNLIYKLQKEAEPDRGKVVRVVVGRKHLGKVGEIFWRGANKFRTYYRNGYNRPESLHNQTVGIKTENGDKFFIALTQVQVVGHSAPATIIGLA